MPSRLVLRCLPPLFSILLLTVAAAGAEPAAVISPNENLVADGLPPIPAEIAEKAGRYGEYRAAALADWGYNEDMLILTRFGDTNQVHFVGRPGAARKQLTFFPDRVEDAVFEPKTNNYFIFHKGAGGAEFFQNYRYDFNTGDITLLTDGKSRNSPAVFSDDGKRVAYTSTRRNGADTDIYTENPLDPKTDRLLAEVKGGGWEVQDWSPDGTQILVLEGVSINESYLWLFDARTGQKTELTPRLPNGERVSRGKARFAKTGAGLYLTDDQGSEFLRMAYFDLGAKSISYPLENIKGDVEDFELSRDEEKIAFTTNEDGFSALRWMNLKTGKYLFYADAASNTASAVWPVPLPSGVISGLRLTSSSLAFTVSSAQSPSDVYSIDTNGKLSRWTESETGGVNPAGFAKPRLVKWTSFDGREISGFLYAPDEKKFPGKRPVIVNIHGGPESQYRPGYLGRNNYYINELGCAMIFPNVRGSSGYGKSFLKLDDGFKREDTYKDIDALLGWIAARPDLDAERIMVTGGSYGGHMTLACATFHADKIRCALDVVGISNLKTFLEHTESYRRDLRRVEYGDERDPKMAEFLERIAPLNNAAKITKPLFVVQGANDPRVPRSEAEQIVGTLKKNGTPVWYLLARDEGHGFAKKKNADFQFYSTVEFIRQYLLK